MERLAQHLLALALRIHVGGVIKGYASREGLPQSAHHVCFVRGLKEAAEPSTAKAKVRDIQGRRAETGALHLRPSPFLPLRGSRNLSLSGQVIRRAHRERHRGERRIILDAGGETPGVRAHYV